MLRQSIYFTSIGAYANQSFLGDLTALEISEGIVSSDDSMHTFFTQILLSLCYPFHAPRLHFKVWCSNERPSSVNHIRTSFYTSQQCIAAASSDVHFLWTGVRIQETLPDALGHGVLTFHWCSLDSSYTMKTNVLLIFFTLQLKHFTLAVCFFGGATPGI